MRCLKELNLNKKKVMHISKNNFFSLVLQWVIAQQHWDIEGRFAGR
jgi:hypothetical protein